MEYHGILTLKERMDLRGNDIEGLKSVNGVVWIAVNDSYFEETDGSRYCIYKHTIQYYENTKWKTFYSYYETVETVGNWGMYVSRIRKNIRCFDIVISGYFAYGQEGENYDYLILSDGSSGVYVDDAHHPTWLNNVRIEQRADKSKMIYVYAIFSDGIKRLVCGESDKISGQKIWKVLTVPDINFSFIDIIPVINKNNKWFVVYDVMSTSWCLLKFDDINYTSYKCPNISYTSKITYLYTDGQDYIWVGTSGNGLYRFDANNATAVETEKQTPSSFTLSTAYPNPFNASTTISFTLNEPGKVNLAVYNLAGQKVREIAAGNYSEGGHTAVWDGKDDSGNAVSSGVYLARMESGGASKVVRMAMVK